MNTADGLTRFLNNTRFMFYGLSGYFFVKDLDSNYVELSQDFESHLKIMRRHVIGKSDYEMPWEDYADQYRRYDLDAIHEERSEVFEPIPLGRHLVLANRCIRLPIRDETGEVVGVLGQTHVLSTSCSLQEAFTVLSQYDKAKVMMDVSHGSYQVGEYNDDLKLTQRETECLFLLIRGKSAKEAAYFLEISSRTVEVYIENIKVKMNVFSRSQIIEKAIALGMLKIIPKNSVLSSLSKNPGKWKEFLTEL